MKEESGAAAREKPLPSGGVGEGRRQESSLIWKKKLPYTSQLKGRIQHLRNNLTPGEVKLWVSLRKMRASTGIKFRRQYPIGPYIADFYCHAYKCVIEVDGLSHDGSGEQDAKRDLYMKEHGITVLRFTESDAQVDPEAIAETVCTALTSALPNPSRREGLGTAPVDRKVQDAARN